tara:strand:+ start:103 stop:249 length:147 start_codon:yes stop_codon:yes gene_type:complete
MFNLNILDQIMSDNNKKRYKKKRKHIEKTNFEILSFTIKVNNEKLSYI